MTAYRMSRVFTSSALAWSIAFIVTFVIVYSTFGPRRQANYVHGWNDFLAFYAGGKLAFTQSLYDPAAISVEQANSGHIAPAALRFIRLPHYAMVLSPLTRLPYIPAFVLWQIVNVGAIIGAVWLWPYPRRVFTCILLACPPVYWGLSLGQDTGLLLLGVSAAVRAIRNSNDGAVGIALAWCLIKFHLIWLAPLALLRRGKALLVFAALCAALLAAPMLINPQWPLQYYETVVRSRSIISNTPQNLFPLLGWYGLPLAVLAILLLSRRVSVELTFLMSLAAAVMVSPHAYLYDYALLAPLVSLATTGSAPVRPSAASQAGQSVDYVVHRDTPFFRQCAAAAKQTYGDAT
jgi:hypothetical protein